MRAATSRSPGRARPRCCSSAPTPARRRRTGRAAAGRGGSPRPATPTRSRRPSARWSPISWAGVAVEGEGHDAAERRAARSWTVTPGTSAERRPQVARPARAPAPRSRRCPTRAGGRRPRRARGGRRRCAPTARTGGRRGGAVGERAGPRGGPQVDERRVEPLHHARPDVEEPGAAGPAQELAAGGGEQVAADLVHVDPQLADRLACVEEEQHAGGPAAPADLGDRRDRSVRRRHVGDRHETDTATVELGVERGEVDLARARRRAAAPPRRRCAPRPGRWTWRCSSTRRSSSRCGRRPAAAPSGSPCARHGSALSMNAISFVSRAEEAGDRGVGAVEQTRRPPSAAS